MSARRPSRSAGTAAGSGAACTVLSGTCQRVERVRRLRGERGQRVAGQRDLLVELLRSAGASRARRPRPGAARRRCRAALHALVDQREDFVALLERAHRDLALLEQAAELHIGARDVAREHHARGLHVGLRRRAASRPPPRSRRGCGRRSRAPTNAPICAVPSVRIEPPSGGG